MAAKRRIIKLTVGILNDLGKKPKLFFLFFWRKIIVDKYLIPSVIPQLSATRISTNSPLACFLVEVNDRRSRFFTPFTQMSTLWMFSPKFDTEIRAHSWLYAQKCCECSRKIVCLLGFYLEFPSNFFDWKFWRTQKYYKKSKKNELKNIQNRSDSIIFGWWAFVASKAINSITFGINFKKADLI